MVLKAIYIFVLATISVESYAKEEGFGDRAIATAREAAAGVLQSAAGALQFGSERTYDLVSIFRPGLRCPISDETPERTAPGLESRPSSRAISESPQRALRIASRDDLLAALAGENLESLDCDIGRAEEMAKKPTEYWKALSEHLKKLERLNAGFERERQKMSAPSPVSVTQTQSAEHQRQLSEKSSFALALEATRKYLAAEIPLSKNPRITSILSKFLNIGAVTGVETGRVDRTVKLLQEAYSHVKQDLAEDRRRFQHAAQNRGQGLSSEDKNAIVKDPFLFSQVEKKYASSRLPAMMCSLNRSFGKGEDFFVGGLQSIAAVAGVSSLGLSALTNSSRIASVLMQRSAGAITLEGARFLAVATSVTANGFGMAAGAASALKCIQQSPNWIANSNERPAGKKCPEDTAIKGLTNLDCIEALLAPLFGSSTTLATGPDLYRINSALVRQRAFSAISNPGLDVQKYVRGVESIWANPALTQNQKVESTVSLYYRERMKRMDPQKAALGRENLRLGDPEDLNLYQFGAHFEAGTGRIFLGEAFDLVRGFPIVKELIRSHEFEHLAQIGKLLPEQVRAFTRERNLTGLNLLLMRPVSPLSRTRTEYEAIGAQFDFLQGIPSDVRQRLAGALSRLPSSEFDAYSNHIRPIMTRAIEGSTAMDRSSYIRHQSLVHGYNGSQEALIGDRVIARLMLAGIIDRLYSATEQRPR